MALKTMSGIRVSVISQIVSLAIKKGVSDLSPIVRKAAALACVKCVRLDPSTRPQVEEYITALLADKQYYVAGAAVQAFMEICPERLDLIHPIYRRLVKMIVDMDEWGQLAVLRLLTVYARKCFPKRTKRVKKAATQEERAKDFYEELDAKEENESDYEDVEVVDPDLDLFLKATQPLLQSRNSAVIMSVTRVYLYLSPTTHLPQTIGPLIALLRSPQDIQQVALHNIVQVCLHEPTLFVPYIRHFLLHATEPPPTWRLKLELLTLLFPHSGTEIQNLILAELSHFSHAHSSTLVRESVRALGRCAAASTPSTSRRCLALLLQQIHSPDANLVGEAIEVIRHLIQRSPSSHQKTVIRLAKNLDTLTSPTARASIIWLVGEFAGYEPSDNIAADVLRILVKGYPEEADEVRAQIILLAAKVYLHHLNSLNSSPTDPASSEAPPHTIELLFQHTLLLARYTPSYDLRDRARLYRALLSVPSSTELASLLLLAPKPVPLAPSPSESRRDLVLGSASLVLGEAIRGGSGGLEVPAWVQEGREPDAKLRDAAADERGGEFVVTSSSSVSAGQRLDEALASDAGYKANGAGKREKSLDAWLDDEEEESESESESESETESEETEYETDSAEEEETAGLVGST